MRLNLILLPAFALAMSLAGSAQAGLFARSDADEDTRKLAPDATFELRFLFRTELGFDPATLVIRAVYEAGLPDEKGVRKETRETSSCPKIPVPFGCTRQKYKVTVTRSLKVPPQWVGPSGANGIAIRVPESLPGPGGYRLSRLQLPCLGEACGRWHERPVELSLGARRPGEAPSAMAAVVHLQTRPSGVFSVAYTGPQRALHPSPGSRAAMSHAVGQDEAQSLQAVQDDTGRWRISPNAIRVHDAYRSCGSVMLGSAHRFQAASYPAMGWARRFNDVGHGEVYGTHMNDQGQLEDLRADNWTGCLVIRAEGSPEHRGSDEEERSYGFLEGRLAYRRIHAYNGRVSIDETVEVDGGSTPLFVRRTVYRHDTRKDVTTRWNRLLQEARPEHPQEPVQLDLKALMAEGEDAKKIVAARLKAR